ncbi:hypothetical protein E7Z59_06550, partial [Robertkochia marina]
MKRLLLIAIFLLSASGFAQVTVQLEDQCNCEVLSGTAVNAAGATSPAGADTGDIYINTTSGTLFFWDGDSWELTSGSNPQIQSFTFDDVSRILTLTMTRGSTANVDLSSLLIDTNTTNVSLTEDGTNLILTDSDSNTVTIPLATLAAATDTNTTNATFAVVGTDLVITDSDGATVDVPLADIAAVVDTDTNTTNVSLTEDGTNLILTDSEGATVSIPLAAITTGVNTDDQQITDFSFDPANNTITLTLEDGGTQSADLTSLNDSGTDDQLLSFDPNTGILTLENGGTVDLSDFTETVTTLTDNGDGTLTYLSEDGTPMTFDSRICVVQDNGDGTYNLTDDFGTNVTINANDVLTTLALNPDNIHLDYRDEAGNLNSVDLTLAVQNLETLTTITENTNGTFTYTGEDGVPQVIDISNMETLTTLVLNIDNTNLDYTDETGTTVQVDLTNAVKNLETLSTLVSNPDGTFTYTDEASNQTIIDVSSLETLTALALNPTNTGLVYTDEDGVDTPIDLTNLVQNLETNTTLSIVAGELVYSNENNDNGNVVLISTDANNNLVPGTDGGLFVAAAPETITSLVDNGNGTFTYTNEAGTPQTVSKSDVTDNGNGTYTFTNGDGTDVTINTSSSSNPYDNVASGLTATNVQAAIDELAVSSGNVSLVDNGDGTYDFTNPDGSTITISDTSLSNLVDNGNGTFTYTNEAGVAVNFDANTLNVTDNADGTYDFTDEAGTMIATVNTNAISNPYDNVTSGLTATNVQAAIDELAVSSGNVGLVDNLDGTYDFTNPDGTTITITDTSLSNLVDNGDGTFSYTNEAGVQVDFDANTLNIVDNLDGTYDFTDEVGTVIATVNTSAASNSYSNVTSGLAATNVQAAIDELAVSSGNVSLVDNLDGTYDFTNPDGSTITITDTSLSNLVDNGNGTFTYTNEAGVEVDFDANTLNIVDNLDGTYDFTDEVGTVIATVNTSAASNSYSNVTSGLA